jgi:LysM repeat protein
MACDQYHARLRIRWNGAFCLALVLLMLPWTGSAQEVPERAKVHMVKRGETLTRIAGIHGVTVEELREWNGIRGTIILVGQELRIPAELEYYRVKTGDTLGKIARQQDVPLKLLRQINDLDHDRIYPGQRLKLQPSHADEVGHVVVAGETLSGIANDHAITVAQLRELNGIRGSTILVGQRLRLREATRSTNCWVTVRILNGKAAIENVYAAGQSLREMAAEKE